MIRTLQILMLLALVNTGPAWSQAGAEADAEAAEAARLSVLLKRYYASEAAAAAGNTDEQQQASDAVDTSSLSANKVRLSGYESLVAIQKISERLGGDSLASPRRELDIIYHVEVRRAGKLLSSKSYSLRSLGKSQFVGKISLPGGEARITVRKDNWKTELEGAASTDYLITLSLPRDAAPELHLIPVADLKAEIKFNDGADTPDWLPYLGAASPNQS